MIILYCDDSFFLNTEYSKKMNHKLEVILKEGNINCVCISICQDVNQAIDIFSKKFEYILFVKSYTRIKFEENTINVTATSLEWNDKKIHPFAHTICYVDTITFEYNRYYLDLFPNQETDIASIMNDAYEDFLQLLFKTTDKEN